MENVLVLQRGNRAGFPTHKITVQQGLFTLGEKQGLFPLGEKQRIKLNTRDTDVILLLLFPFLFEKKCRVGGWMWEECVTHVDTNTKPHVCGTNNVTHVEIYTHTR